MNQVCLIGRAGKDPELRYFDNGGCKGEISLAIPRYLGEGKEPATDWIRITAWGKTAEVLGEYVRKGDRVGVTGSLKYEEWTDQSGNKRNQLKVAADRIDLLEPKRESNSQIVNRPQQTQQTQQTQQRGAGVGF